MRKIGSRSGIIVASAVIGSLILAACGGGGSSSDAGSASAAASGEAAGGAGAPQKGGTITILTNAEQLQTLDPQVIYTGEDLAFLGATIMRSLTTYQMSPDNAEGTSLVADMATDTGTASNGGKTWQFTLKDGIMWEDGKPVTCQDVAYGVSRTFATDIIAGGPTYALVYLDIPTNEDGSSQYKGPYSGEGQELFDKAVTCDGNTITFNLNQPVPDFNYTVTLGFSAVRKDADTGADYAMKPLSNGPYKIESYQTGKGGKLVLVRNDQWDPATDSWRLALPDSWVYDFGLDEAAIDQRIIASSGPDEYALTNSLMTASLPIVFDNPQYESRRIDAFDPYTRYIAIDTVKIPNEKCRQAIGVAIDREALRTIAGGKYAGDFADGLVKPNIGIDYAPTGLWDGLLGQAVPPTGDAEFAKKLIAEAGDCPTEVTLDYAQSADNDKAAAVWVDSLAKVGITLKPNPIEPGQYYGIVFDPEKAHELITAGWGPDWPNASTVIPPLTTINGGFDLSRWDDATWVEKVKAASQELDRAKQATMWQELNTEASRLMLTIPTRFGRDQRMAGSKVAPIYSWPAYGSWPYADMYVVQ
ncbi:MAG: ABC transporter substrate-binding protein [Actinomycetales bacterium]